ncbi:hypothetical protein Salmuc_05481 [Salipiger mucosus DSM 16094]|uniref:Uncharacterized protein n=1 Tax=Salipiger mucosus DSM 16094 TaxID=1123237 RepID=S9S7K8_9RHOB|nr:hypothetical protein Salmuc_05481 [Salipiger mucosus DSM 16094]
MRGILYELGDAVDEAETGLPGALVLATAHLCVARAWAGRPGAPEPSALRRDARALHLESADRLLDRFDPLEEDSPMLAALRCHLLERQPRAAARLADDYEDLIDLDPACPDHMRALGRDLAPSRFGSWERLDHEARRTAGRTADVWGTGAYAWVWFDALAADPAGFEHVESEFFAEALHDILECRPDQHTANVIAAYCGLSLSGTAERGSARARIAGCFGWIVADHLREVHPAIWARARPRTGATDPAAALRRGRVRALSTLAEHFAPQLARGATVVIDARGVHTEQGPAPTTPDTTGGPQAQPPGTRAAV